MTRCGHYHCPDLMHICMGSPVEYISSNTDASNRILLLQQRNVGMTSASAMLVLQFECIASSGVLRMILRREPKAPGDIFCGYLTLAECLSASQAFVCRPSGRMVLHCLVGRYRR